MLKPGDIVRRKQTITRVDDVPETAHGYVVSIDPSHNEEGRLKPRPIAIAWDDSGSLRRHFEFELERVDVVDESIVVRVMQRLVERIERG